MEKYVIIMDMTFLLIFACIIAPAVLWVLYFYHKDRFQPEPVRVIAVTFIMGFIAGYFCFKSYGILPFVGIPADPSIMMEHERFLFFWYCLGPVGLMEELFKFVPFMLIIRFFKSFDEELDGIIYAAVIALGFASYENLHYLKYLEGFELIGRSIASPLTHGVFSAFWGYTVGYSRLAQRGFAVSEIGSGKQRINKAKKKSTWSTRCCLRIKSFGIRIQRILMEAIKKSLLIASLVGITISALIHGVFDFFTTSPTLRLFSAFVILAAWIWRIRIIERLHKIRENQR